MKDSKKQRKILIIDDSPIIREMMKFFLVSTSGGQNLG